MTWIDLEREALAAAFRTAGPDAATLCTGWATRHLLAHLVQGENQPLANIVDQLSRRPPGEEKHLGRLVASTRTDTGFETLIRRFADGPHRWSPMNWAGESLNLLEFIIHHEDVRRGGADQPRPRDLPAEETRVIFQRLPTLARLAYRHAPVGVMLVSRDGDRQIVKKGDRQVQLRRAPIELALYLSGRQRAAAVQVDGTPEGTEAFSSWQSSN
jgi:uncharacterized protein (TIGR03085 family)